MATPMRGLSSDGNDRGDAPVSERLVPLGRVATPDEVARAVLYVVTEAASYFTGDVLIIDGRVTAGRSFPMALGGAESYLNR